jgi:pyruvate/2-oxoglutarate dehydrogenase complex dihydrolipoamide dehydrogenase (E3) component
MESRHFDALVIGTGQAGPPLAARLAGAGRSVCIVERASFGGTCVNNGCTPTKTLVASAYAAHMARRASEYGIDIGGPVVADMKRVKARKDEIVRKASHAVEKWMRSLNDVTVVQGHARFDSPRSVTVGGERFGADAIFINVGGRSAKPEGLPAEDYLTSETVMDVDFLPEHLVIVGGSYSGLEFGQMYRRFGSRITIVEKGPRLIGREDRDISLAVEQILRNEGIDLRLNASCISAARRNGGIEVSIDCSEGAPVVAGSHVLFATGRVPDTGDLGLERAGIRVDAGGFIPVNDGLETEVRGIYALGDCNGRGAFTHTSYNDYEIVADNLLGDAHRKVTDRIAIYALFIDPPLGRVGMTMEQAKRGGARLLVGKKPMVKVARAVERGESQGFMKVIVDAETRRILGAAVLGVTGDEAVHSLVDAMYAGVTADQVARGVRIHPTVSELIPTMLGELRPAEAADA